MTAQGYQPVCTRECAGASAFCTEASLRASPAGQALGRAPVQNALAPVRSLALGAIPITFFTFPMQNQPSATESAPVEDYAK